MHREHHGFSDQDMADVARVDLKTLSALFPGDFTAPRLPLRVVRATDKRDD